MSLQPERSPYERHIDQFAELKRPIPVPLILSRSSGASRSSHALNNWRVLDQTSCTGFVGGVSVLTIFFERVHEKAIKTKILFSVKVQYRLSTLRKVSEGRKNVSTLICFIN